MFKYTTFCVITVACATNAWVFNNVDPRELATKGFDFDLDYELESEINEEYYPQTRLSLIFPGTKWCGAGNVADNFDDLGPAKETDMCCRTHDNCPDVIPAGETKQNLTNDAFYTRLSCDCDETFRQCLRKVNSKTSKIIGKMYFNAIGTRCYKNEYPISTCKRRGGWFNKKCVEYELDTNGDKCYQWFDVPNFYDGGADSSSS